MKEFRFLDVAKKASLRSDHKHHHIGVALVKGGRVISTGFNSNKKSPRSPHRFHSVHAEVKAILAANTDVEGATAYVFRQTKSGDMAMSRPCASCAEFLVSKGIRTIVYSFEGSFKKEKIA